MIKCGTLSNLTFDLQGFKASKAPLLWSNCRPCFVYHRYGCKNIDRQTLSVRHVCHKIKLHCNLKRPKCISNVCVKTADFAGFFRTVGTALNICSKTLRVAQSYVTSICNNVYWHGRMSRPVLARTDVTSRTGTEIHACVFDQLIRADTAHKKNNHAVFSPRLSSTPLRVN